MTRLTGQQRNLLLALHNFGHGKEIMNEKKEAELCQGTNI